MKRSSSCGVYQARNIHNGKRYVGSTKDLCKREYGHRNDLKNGNHSSPLFQNAWNKYGPDAFVFKMIEITSDNEKDLLAAEQLWIDALAPEYNVSLIAGRVGWTPEVRAKIGAANARRPMTDERKAHLRTLWKGQRHSVETKAKIGAAHKGKTISVKTRKKMSSAAKAREGAMLPAMRAKREFSRQETLQRSTREFMINPYGAS